MTWQKLRWGWRLLRNEAWTWRRYLVTICFQLLHSLATFLLIPLNLIVEIEPGLDLTQWTQNSCLSTQVVKYSVRSSIVRTSLSFVTNTKYRLYGLRGIRPIRFERKKTIRRSLVITSAFTLIQQPDFVHLVLDSYIQCLWSTWPGMVYLRRSELQRLCIHSVGN